MKVNQRVQVVVAFSSLMLVSALTSGAEAQTVAEESSPFPAGVDASVEWSEPLVLHVDAAASVDADELVTDEPIVVEDVELSSAFGTNGVRSYTFDANGARVYFEPPALVNAPLVAAAGGTWWDGVCTDGESRYAVVKDYPRARAHKRMERSYARMYCGKKDRYSQKPYSESAFGIRHIRPYHKSQFAKLAAWQGSTWGHWMHWSLRWVMSEPSWRTVQNADRFCYEKPFYFVNPSGSQVKRYVIAILGKTGVRIMTAFPRKTDYCQGTRF